MFVAATESPCVASSYGVLPCVMGQASRSARRRGRARKVAVWLSIRESAELKAHLLKNCCSSIFSDSTEHSNGRSILSAGAPKFVPRTGLQVDEASFQFTLKETNIVDSSAGMSVPQRRILRDAQTIVCASALVCPATPLASACKVVADASLGAGTQPLARHMLRDTCIADILPDVPVPCASTCKVFDDAMVSAGSGVSVAAEVLTLEIAPERFEETMIYTKHTSLQIVGMIDELRETIALQEELQCHEHVATLLNLVTAIQRNMNDSHRWPVADIREVVRKLLTNEAQVDSP